MSYETNKQSHVKHDAETLLSLFIENLERTINNIMSMVETSPFSKNKKAGNIINSVKDNLKVVDMAKEIKTSIQEHGFSINEMHEISEDNSVNKILLNRFMQKDKSIARKFAIYCEMTNNPIHGYSLIHKLAAARKMKIH